MKISRTEELILTMLIMSGQMYGLELVKNSDGELKRGTVYVTLGRMEDKGLVEVIREERPEGQPGMARPRYKASGLGERVMKELIHERQLKQQKLAGILGV